jgi:hypothetical protein
LVGQAAGHPAAFLVVLVYAVLWLTFSPTTFEWNAVFAMTLFIQRANRRDSLALHAKLDELLRVDGDARSELTQLDGQEPEVIERYRDEEVRKRALIKLGARLKSDNGWCICPKFSHPIKLFTGNERRFSGLFRRDLCLTIPEGETTWKSVPVTISRFNASRIPR